VSILEDSVIVLHVKLACPGQAWVINPSKSRWHGQFTSMFIVSFGSSDSSINSIFMPFTELQNICLTEGFPDSYIKIICTRLGPLSDY